jgi:hypothetical protein
METDIHAVLSIITHQLPDAGVPCIMIGGHAVNYYGVLRATQDIDFMIAASSSDRVRDLMKNAGFTNISLHDSVMFFNRPDTPLRIDFLIVDSETMDKLLVNAVQVNYAGADTVLVPQLADLLAMKLFALANGGPKRKDKDFGDIVNLVIENSIKIDELRSLTQQFATAALFAELNARIQELRDA